MSKKQKTLVWIGNPFFCRRLQDHGWRVVHHNFYDVSFFSWPDIVDLAGGEPDVLVLGDKSMPPFLPGVERFPCLTVFFCVDSHIHSWYPGYARAFDLTVVTLKDNLPPFAGDSPDQSRLLWLPAYAPEDARPVNTEKQWDALFVGTVDAQTTPGRHAFLTELASRLPGLKIMRGNYRDLFPRARIVLNYAERGDLNFRVFEALGCGSCLVTPRVGHGQDELFTDGTDLFLYLMDDMDGLLGKIEYCLAEKKARERAARNGLDKIDRGHRASHRAASLSDWIKSRPAEDLVRERLTKGLGDAAEHLRLIYLHFAGALEDPFLKQAYLKMGREVEP